MRGILEKYIIQFGRKYWGEKRRTPTGLFRKIFAHTVSKFSIIQPVLSSLFSLSEQKFFPNKLLASVIIIFRESFHF